MNIEFSTTQSNYVEQYLKHEDFNWLNEKQKEYVLNNIGDIRVQDPMMYRPARLAIHNNGELHAEEIKRLGNVPLVKVVNTTKPVEEE
jgi:hypothetical protein